MPRIRRWHPVSHDFNWDPEVGELRDRFGDWMGYVWLEILSRGDRNEGRIQGKPDQIALGLASVSRRKRPSFASKRIRNALDFMQERGWIRLETEAVLICKYSEYHKTREHKNSHKGTDKAPLLSYPSEPSFPNPPIPPKGASHDNGLDQAAASVIAHLNRAAGTSFRTGAKESVAAIRARLRDGFTHEDLVAVIDDRVRRWRDDAERNEYLRPSTLFRPKNFEGYLQAAKLATSHRPSVAPGNPTRTMAKCPRCHDHHFTDEPCAGEAG